MNRSLEIASSREKGKKIEIRNIKADSEYLMQVLNKKNNQNKIIKFQIKELAEYIANSAQPDSSLLDKKLQIHKDLASGSSEIKNLKERLDFLCSLFFQVKSEVSILKSQLVQSKSSLSQLKQEKKLLKKKLETIKTNPHQAWISNRHSRREKMKKLGFSTQSNSTYNINTIKTLFKIS